MININKNLIWNYGSIIIMAIAGLIMNTVIAVTYGSETFGVFSETYAWYTILSQLSVWGIHMAIVKFVPEKENDSEKGSLLKSGIAIVIITSLIITILSEIIVFLLGDFVWKEYMQIALTGLVLMSINKVLINYLNALSRMVAFAIFTAIRYAFFGTWIWSLSALHIDSIYLSTVFIVTEIVVFLSLLVYFMFRVPVLGRINKLELKQMTYFGTKVIPSYMVLEMNTKVDVVCLGFLSTDASQIGIYSFAIFFYGRLLCFICND